MQRNRPPLMATAAILLVIAMTLSGTLLSVLPAIVMKVLLPNIYAGYTMRFSQPRIESFALFGIALAVPLARLSNWRLIGGLLLLGWLLIATMLGLSLPFYRVDAEAPPELLVAPVGAAVSLLALCSILFPTWLGRLRDQSLNPLSLFAYFFLGCVIGAVGNLFGLDPFLTLSQQIVCALILLASAGIAFLAVYCSLIQTQLLGEVADTSAPKWPRRVRWMLRGGLPGCVVFGVPSYVATEISAIPLFWIVPFIFAQVTWVVAFARMTAPKATMTGWVAQFLAALAILAVLGFVRVEEPTREFAWLLVSIGLFLCAAFLPHRLTLVVQSVLLVLILLQIFAVALIDVISSFGIISIIIAHTLLCIITCRGCYDDVVMDAPAADRLPEFLLCLFGSFIVCSFAYEVLPPLLVPPSWGLIEYPILLVVSLIVRVWPGGQRRRP